jgi:type I restriction enzyme, S subunit
MKIEMKPIFDVTEIVMGQSPTGDTYNHIADGLPLLNGPTEFGYYNPECTMYTTDSKRESKQGDLIFCVRGSTTGRMNWADQIYSLGRGVCAIRGESQLRTKYIKYCLDAYLDGLLQLANGGTFPNLSRNDIGGFKIPYSDKVDEIASILSDYDDLIENNLKRIKLLEEKAQLHYKELISDGNTEKKYFEEFCSIVHGYAFKSTDFSEDKTFDIVVRMGNFREGGGLQFDNNTKYLNEHFEYNPKYKLEPNDLVMVLSDVTREGRIIGNVGFIPFNDKTYLLNQRVGKIVADEKYKEWLYVSFNSKEFKEYCLSCANSATVLNFNNKDLFKFRITIPKESELISFTEKVKPIFKLINTLGEQNTKLRQARDILLPKLMNGQIEV